MKIEEFVLELKKINIEITKNQLAQLDKYYNLLVEWNQKLNLTSITKKEDVYLKHFYDSLTIVKATDLNKVNSLCDVGTGAGFPGIVLKIIFPNLNVILIDSLNKRINFLNEIINKLELDNIKAIHTRMEDYSKENIEKFDIITSRAVAKIQVLSEISFQALKIGGQLVLLKGQCEEEIAASREILKKINGKVKNIIKFQLPIENSNRTIVIIEKVAKTPNKYPRRYSEIKKNPL